MKYNKTNLNDHFQTLILEISSTAREINTSARPPPLIFQMTGGSVYPVWGLTFYTVLLMKLMEIIFVKHQQEHSFFKLTIAYIPFLTTRKSMINNLLKAEIERWISEAKQKHPEHPRYPEIVMPKDAIIKIAGKCFAQKVFRTLYDMGIMDKKLNPAQYFIDNGLAISCWDLASPEDAKPEDLERCYVLTVAGYEVLLQLVKHQLKASQDK